MDNIYLINIETGKLEKIIIESKNDIIKKIYYLKYRLPTQEEITDFGKTDKEIKIFFNKYSLENIKKYISNIDDNIPLFNIYHLNIYLSKKEDVYYKVMYNKYRFPEKSIIRHVEQKILELNNEDNVIKRKKRKIKLILDFLNQLDLNELYNSYLKTFVKYSPDIGNIIIGCTKPSFIDIYEHLSPYYTRIELIRLAQNMNLELQGDPRDPDNLEEICKIVRNNDINSDVILAHNNHIINNDKVSLIKYYTIQGSYVMNQYMRNLTSYSTQNIFLENIIQPMWNLILTAPKFDNNYFLYRFIDNDFFIENLEIGGIYTEPGFMSTTRYPFYRHKNYNFGFILLKIKIPKNIKGIALSVETVSRFPEEQEIIFPPGCKFKLISKDDNCNYFHIDDDYVGNIKIRYEFEWISNSDIEFTRKKNKKEDNLLTIDFFNLDKIITTSLREKIKIFTSTYLNEMNLFKIDIGGKTLELLGEPYNSDGATSEFYSLRTSSGFSIYTILNSHVLFMIELAEIDNVRNMHINYYLQYTNIQRNKIIPDDYFIKFISSIALYFQIPNVIIYSDFMSCDDLKKSLNFNKQRNYSSTLLDNDSTFIKYRSMPIINNNKNESDKRDKKNRSEFKKGSRSRSRSRFRIRNTEIVDTTYFSGHHSLDVYNYLKYKQKKFSQLNSLEFSPLFNYDDLDILYKEDPIKILDKDDKDDLYQIYLRNYYPDYKEKSNIAHFYLYISVNYCYLMTQLISKMDRLYDLYNPFEILAYSFNAYTYLYNRNMILFLPENTYEVFNLKQVYTKKSDNYLEITDKIKKKSLF